MKNKLALALIALAAVLVFRPSIAVAQTLILITPNTTNTVLALSTNQWRAVTNEVARLQSLGTNAPANALQLIRRNVVRDLDEMERRRIGSDLRLLIQRFTSTNATDAARQAALDALP